MHRPTYFNCIVAVKGMEPSQEQNTKIAKILEITKSKIQNGFDMTSCPYCVKHVKQN